MCFTVGSARKREGQWSPRETRLPISRQLSDVWLRREDSFPQYRMTPDMVLKQGFLYKKRERSSAAPLRKPWQTGYFVLKKSPGYAGLLLDEYRDASLRVAKQTLFLDTVKHVGPVNTSRSKQYAFQVVVLGRSPLFFACDNELLRSEWMDVFAKCSDELLDQALPHGRTSPEGGPSSRQTRQTNSSSVYVDMKTEEGNHRTSISENKGYEVQIQKTPLSEDNNLHGSYMLQICKSRIALRHMDRKDYVLSWPLTQLRGFKSQPDQQQIILETGRRCHFGKGRLSLKTRYVEAIIHDIREVISSESLSSDNSSDSEPDNNHQSVSRTMSEQQCNVTVSVRPRRIHSDRVINQLAVGRAPNSKVASKSANAAQISPTFMPPTNFGIKSPLVPTENSGEDAFSFDDKLGLFTESKTKEELQKASNWKTSTTFSKTMIESRSDNEHSSNECEDETDDHPYIDIIPNEETSDEASTWLAQVVADLTEPQKRNCFRKSNSTGGIQGKPVGLKEGRRASAPVVGSEEYIASSTVAEVENQGSLSNTQWKLKLEKINEVSFVETTDNGDGSSSPKVPSMVGRASSVKSDRPRSLSELLAVELETPMKARSDFHRSSTFLGVTKAGMGSSLTDLSSARHRGLRAALSLSPNFSHQIERDSCHFGFTAGSGKIPSFPKSSVVRAGLENPRSLFSMSPLPPDFHPPNSHNSFSTEADQISPVSPTFNETVPPRPPKESNSKHRRSKSTSRSPPPPLPERSPSLPVTLAKEKTPHLKFSTFDGFPGAKPYANAPPKVQPRLPNTVPLQNTATDNSFESISPPPRPPKPESLCNSARKNFLEQSRQPMGVVSPVSFNRRLVSDKRTDGYPWDMDREKDGSPQLGIMNRPLVTVTPPRSPKLNKIGKVKKLMRGISQSDSDIRESLEQRNKAALESTQSAPRS